MFSSFEADGNIYGQPMYLCCINGEHFFLVRICHIPWGSILRRLTSSYHRSHEHVAHRHHAWKHVIWSTLINAKIQYNIDSDENRRIVRMPSSVFPSKSFPNWTPDSTRAHFHVFSLSIRNTQSSCSLIHSFIHLPKGLLKLCKTLRHNIPCEWAIAVKSQMPAHRS